MTGESEVICRHLWVQGRVQGVYYRASTVQVARELGLTGWVRNRHDGRVEAVVCGPAQAVHRLVHWAHQGPIAARVDAVQVTAVEPADWGGPFTEFQQVATA
ncbi:acylphosphatase [Hydrogenophaga soli]